MPAPPWLQDEPQIGALLAAVLDRFDRQPGESRERAIVVPVARSLTNLRRGDAQADLTWECIGELERAELLAIKHGRRSAYDLPWHNAKLAFHPASEPVLRDWLQRPALESFVRQWQRAVEQAADRFPGGYAALLARPINIAGRTAAEVVDAVASIGEIKSAATLRQISTHVFWGASKILDGRGDLIAALFPGLAIRPRSIVAAVHLPVDIRGVLFIENQDTYTAAVDGEPAAAANHALIYMAGFRGAAARIRSRDGVSLHFGGPGSSYRRDEFERWWFAAVPLPVEPAFWGDLDFAGMQILKALRMRFGDVVAWRHGYEPMLQNRRRCGASPSLAAELPAQADPGTTGCSYADTQLLPTIREYGFWDQETIGR